MFLCCMLLLLLLNLGCLVTAESSEPRVRIRCNEWSIWEARPWGAARCREACTDGRVEEQCRSSGSGLIIACRPGDAGALALAPMLNSRLPLRNNFVYSAYKAFTSYSSPSSVQNGTYVCASGCIAGVTCGTLGTLLLFVAGTVAMYRNYWKRRERVAEHRQENAVIAARIRSARTTIIPLVPSSTPNLLTVAPSAAGTVTYENYMLGNGFPDGGQPLPAYQIMFPTAHPGSFEEAPVQHHHLQQLQPPQQLQLYTQTNLDQKDNTDETPEPLQQRFKEIRYVSSADSDLF